MYEIYYKPITWKSVFGNYLCKSKYVNSYAVIWLLHLEAFKNRKKLMKKHSRMQINYKLIHHEQM